MNRKRAQGGIWLLLSVASSLGACWLPRGCLWRLRNRKSVQGGIRPGYFCMFACLGAWPPRGCLWGVYIAGAPCMGILQVTAQGKEVTNF